MMLRKPSSSHHVWLRRSYISLSTGMGPSPRTNADRTNRIRPPPPLASTARPELPRRAAHPRSTASPRLRLAALVARIGATSRGGCCAKGRPRCPYCHCDKRRSSSAVSIGRLVCGRRRPYAPDATGSGRVALLVFVRRECRGGGRRDAPCRARDAKTADWTLDGALPLLTRATGTQVEGLSGGPDPLAAIREAVEHGSFDEIIIT